MMTSDFSLSHNRGAPVTQDLQEGMLDSGFGGPMDNETVARFKIRMVP
jgi:hypothetical protein